MRPITDHTLNPTDAGTTVTAIDAPDPNAGGACHEYRLGFGNGAALIEFQHGPVKEHGRNGVTEAQLLAVLIDRYRSFQAGPFASHYNATTLDALEAALAAQHQRTRDREARAVEGTNQK